MILKYYGTAASEGVPGIFCTCQICIESRQFGGRNVRTRSQALVDGRLLLDFPPDTYLHVLDGGLNLPEITSCLITHSHEDHLYVRELENRKLGFAYDRAVGKALPTPLRLYGSEVVAAAIRTEDRYDLERDYVIEIHEVAPFQPFDVDDFTITAMPADHDPTTGPLIYSIARTGKTMLYAHDTGYFPESTWYYLEESCLKFDLVSLDCTGMTLSNYRNGHMGLSVNMEVRERMRSLGCVSDLTKFVVNHFSHNGGCTHDRFAPTAENHGFIASYDGLELIF